MKPDEEALYNFCTELHETHFVSDATYRVAFEQFGSQGVVDMTGLIGHYTMVSMTLNAFEVEIPGKKDFPLSN